MSTFSGLSTAYTGLVAARQGIDTVGQNMANTTTEGYTRQRVNTSALDPVSRTGLMATGPRAGQGVSVDSITRLDNALLDTRVRTTRATDGFWTSRSASLGRLEASLREPSNTGIATTLNSFWAAWQQVANRPGNTAASNVVIEAGRDVADRIASGYRAVSDEWSVMRAEASSTVTDLNDMAGSIAQLNDQIRQTIAAGGSANELMDRRSLLTAKVAELSGAVVRTRDDGMVDVLVGGNTLVSGTASRSLVITGANRLLDVATTPLALAWSDKPGAPIAADGGRLAASLGLLAQANASGTGGALAEAAASYDALAVQLQQSVNAIHSAGSTPAGTSGLSFFSLAAGLPAALGLTVVPTDSSGIATGQPANGSLDGSVADSIAAIGRSASSPDVAWSNFVVSVGVTTRSAIDQSSLSGAAATSADTAQKSQASVDMDEETTSLMTYQHSYQAAARVISAIDEMLDTLINRTGLVGR